MRVLLFFATIIATRICAISENQVSDFTWQITSLHSSRPFQLRPLAPEKLPSTMTYRFRRRHKPSRIFNRRHSIHWHSYRHNHQCVASFLHSKGCSCCKSNCRCWRDDGHPQHQHRGCHITAPIPPLANNNHAYARRDNGSDMLFNNQPTMGECDGSSAFRLDLIENQR